MYIWLGMCLEVLLSLKILSLITVQMLLKPWHLHSKLYMHSEHSWCTVLAWLSLATLMPYWITYLAVLFILLIIFYMEIGDVALLKNMNTWLQILTFVKYLVFGPLCVTLLKRVVIYSFKAHELLFYSIYLEQKRHLESNVQIWCILNYSNC